MTALEKKIQRLEEQIRSSLLYALKLSVEGDDSGRRAVLKELDVMDRELANAKMTKSWIYDDVMDRKLANAKMTQSWIF